MKIAVKIFLVPRMVLRRVTAEGLFPIPIPAPLFAVGYLVYSWYSSRYSRDGINHTAHIDGAVVGLLFVALTNPGVYRQLLALIG